MAHNEVIINKPFAEALDLTRAAIVSNGFLIIHEINTTLIMNNAGYVIPEIRQLLFFHPTYMKSLLDVMPEAVISVPLKIVLTETKDNTTKLMFTDPMILFQDAPLLRGLRDDLSVKLSAILEAHA
jgi:uncharacterized protein (DUF302 family)